MQRRPGKALTRLGDLPSAGLELLFEIGAGLASLTTTLLCFGRMKLVTSRSALRPFAGQGHLRGRTLERDGRSAAGRMTGTAHRSRSSSRRDLFPLFMRRLNSCIDRSNRQIRARRGWPEQVRP